jgi:hypothetical protein
MWNRSRVVRGQIGQKLGERTITGISHEDESGRTVFNYECSCGSVGKSTFTQLQHHERCRTCGPLRGALLGLKRMRELGKIRFDKISEALIGRRFGCSVILEFSHSEKNHRYYRIKCDSGVEYIATRNWITRHKGLNCRHCWRNKGRVGRS